MSNNGKSKHGQPSGQPPIIPPLTGATLYITRKSVNVSSWGTFYPGVSVPAPIPDNVWIDVALTIQRAISQASLNVTVREWNGEVPKLGVSTLLVYTGDLPSWPSPLYPPGSTSGLHGIGSFYTAPTYRSTAFSFGFGIFGLNALSLGASGVLEGLGGAGGLIENPDVLNNWMWNWGSDPTWTTSQISFLQSVYGKR